MGRRFKSGKRETIVRNLNYLTARLTLWVIGTAFALRVIGMVFAMEI
jgi:hypothetical protein